MPIKIKVIKNLNFTPRYETDFCINCWTLSSFCLILRTPWLKFRLAWILSIQTDNLVNKPISSWAHHQYNSDVLNFKVLKFSYKWSAFTGSFMIYFMFHEILQQNPHTKSSVCNVSMNGDKTVYIYFYEISRSKNWSQKRLENYLHNTPC